MNRNKQLMGAVLIILGLMCLLSVMLPMGYGFWSDAYLLSADMERPAIDGQLSEQAQEIPIVYALYRKRILSGFDMSTATREMETTEQANRLRELLEGLKNADVLPRGCWETANEIFRFPSAMAYDQEQDGFQQNTYLGYPEAEALGTGVEVMVQQHEQTELVTACTIAGGVQPQDDADDLLHIYRSYLGMDSLQDWKKLETQEESAAWWSEMGQIYLFCSLQEGRFFIGAFSLPKEELLAADFLPS